MAIEWRKITWYSKAATFVFFIVLPFVGFYLGVEYQKFAAVPAFEFGGDRQIIARGTFVFGGVQCRRFQANNGTYYTLVGDKLLIWAYQDGVLVEIRGVVAENSYCNQDITIKVFQIIPL